MTEYYEEGGLLYEQSPPMHIKVESPEGPFGGGVSEDGFPREDDDSEGSCDQNSGLPVGLPFNVVVVHPNIMAPGMSSDELMSIEQSRGMSAVLAAGGASKRKSRFSGAELEVLVSEVTRCEGELFGPAGRLRRRERERIWAGILERVNAVSRVPRTLREVKKRWDDLKRRNGGRLADARHRSCYLPSSRGASIFGRPSQSSPRLQQTRQTQSSRSKASFPCLTDSEAVGTGDGSERDCLEKEEDTEQEREEGEPDCEGTEHSMEDKLGLGLSLGIGPPPPSERWLPPSPLYSAPFLNGSPQPSPPPSLGAQQGPLETQPRSSWLEDELRSLGDAALQLGDRVEKSLMEFGEGFRRDMRTLVASQEMLASSLQQNNILLQRLLGVLESPAAAAAAITATAACSAAAARSTGTTTHIVTTTSACPTTRNTANPSRYPTRLTAKPSRSPTTLTANTGYSSSRTSVVPQSSPGDAHDASHSDRPTAVNGTTGQRQRRGRTVEHRRRRRR
ncbi:hypothetical protein NHX12_001580 [Muraenolepis orangiensis]|uniref:Myb/SANT-like DNA-binding domain-containing protein n=1 Tax=Muraenolepis orangiensis TaxID=630683 RepID=A0A9Q0E2D4_9TELE|nr:hypothetical protein NHX12_001580 [Muraenolepis orangiensis]